MCVVGNGKESGGGRRRSTLELCVDGAGDFERLARLALPDPREELGLARMISERSFEVVAPFTNRGLDLVMLLQVVVVGFEPVDRSGEEGGIRGIHGGAPDGDVRGMLRKAP